MEGDFSQGWFESNCFLLMVNYACVSILPVNIHPDHLTSLGSPGRQAMSESNFLLGKRRDIFNTLGASTRAICALRSDTLG